MRIRCFIGLFGDADVGYAGYAGVGFEVGDEGVFVGDAGFVAADCYAEGCGL